MPRIRTVIALTAVLALVAAGGASPLAWGFEAHKVITAHAIEHLPPEIRPFFRRHRVMLVEHSIDPDLWRNAGWVEEPPRHFLDIDDYGPPPYDALPRDYEAAVAKFGKERVHKNGLLPWRLAEMYDKLVGAFRDHARNRPFALENIKFFTAVLSHYASDGHVPFHAVVNYDGQLTGQHGIHARFESEMFERFAKQIRLKPAPITIAQSPRDFTFETLVASAALVPPILEADRIAIGDGDTYDAAYFRVFFERTRPILEQRLSDSVSVVAALVTKAWIEAGRPSLPAGEAPRPDRKKRAPAATPAPTGPTPVSIP